MDERAIVAGMRLEDKVALGSGADVWNTKAMPKYDIPALNMADGPHGLRKQPRAGDMLGLNKAIPATCFAAEAATGCSWDEALLEEIGRAIAKEAKAGGVDLVLGPGANIKRNPLCGRNFEYFSEDPYLTGKLAAAFIRGAEGEGIATCVKHFVCNNQEYKRFSSDSIVDERTLREIYLAGFEMAVRQGGPSAVMSAYNKVNGRYCSTNQLLLTDILRSQWGFDGMVLTDWGALSDRIEAFRAGCDLSMPGGSCFMERAAVRAVEEGTLDEACVDRSARRIVRLARRQRAMRAQGAVDMAAHHALARRAACESAVLLKNDDRVLPIEEGATVAFIGHMAKVPRYQGGGSSHINPWQLVGALDACPDVRFAEGYDAKGHTTQALLREAAQVARGVHTAVVFAGLPDAYESEGFDRDDMQMPPGHVRLIEAVAEANANTVVVLMSGGVVEMPWAEAVRGILWMSLAGQACGEAARDLLFGRAVPSGKLAESWPYRYEDCVSAPYYAAGCKDAHYREGVYVGYRYYETAGVRTRYPFGFGLSYASFAYEGLIVEGDTATVTVKNTGGIQGAEVVQLYIEKAGERGYRPRRELKGFQKVRLRPGESRAVSFALDERSFAVWQDGWVVPGGEYRVQIGQSSRDIRLECAVERPGPAWQAAPVPAWYLRPRGPIEHADWERLLGRAVAEKPLKKGEFTMENTIMEMKNHSLFVRLLFRAMNRVIVRQSCNDGERRMMMNTSADASLSGIQINGGIKGCAVQGLLEIANGHYARGLRLLFTRKRA